MSITLNCFSNRPAAQHYCVPSNRDARRSPFKQRLLSWWYFVLGQRCTHRYSQGVLSYWVRCWRKHNHTGLHMARSTWLYRQDKSVTITWNTGDHWADGGRTL